MTQFTVDFDLRGRDGRLRFDLDPKRRGQRGIGDALQGGRVYEPDVTAFLVRALGVGDLFVDVGAHVGYFSLLASRLVAPGGRVIAFEPAADNAAVLRRHVSLNGLDNVTVIEHPVADTAGPRSFFRNADNDGGHALWDPGVHSENRVSAEHRDVRELAAVTVAGTLAELVPGQVPTAMKIDTEGAEALILRGTAPLLHRGGDTGCDGVRFVVCELHDFGLYRLGSSPAALRGFMGERGYETFLLGRSGGLPKWIPEGVSLRCDYVLNLLFARPADLVALYPVEVVDPERT